MRNLLARAFAAVLLVAMLGVPAHAVAMGGGNKAEQAKPAAVTPAATNAAAPAVSPAAPAKTGGGMVVASAVSSDSSAGRAKSSSRSGVFSASVTFLKGMARIQSSGSTKFSPLSLGSTISDGDTVVTLENARMEIKLETGQVVRLGPTTKFTLQGMKKTNVGGVKGVFKVVSGRLWFTIRASTRSASPARPRSVVG